MSLHTEIRRKEVSSTLETKTSKVNDPRSHAAVMDTESRPRSHSASGSLSTASVDVALTPEETMVWSAAQPPHPQAEPRQGAVGEMEIKVPSQQRGKIQVCCRRCLSFTRSRLFGVWALGRWSAGLQVVGLVMAIVALSTPYWEDWPDEFGDIYSGLWTVCVFHKCSSLVYKDIKAWLVAVQVLMCISLVIQVKALVFMLLHLCVTRFYPHRRLLTVVNITFIAQAFVVSVIGLSIYGGKQGFRSGTLARSYALAWLGPVFLAPALVCSCLLLRTQSSRSHDKRPILQHSISVDSGHLSPTMLAPQKAGPRPVSPVAARERAGSELRARATSVTALMPAERGCDRRDVTHDM